KISNQSAIRQTRNLGLSVAFFMAFGAVCFAQTNKRVIGTLSDQNGAAVTGASVKLVSDVDSVQTSSGAGGVFSFNNIKGRSVVLTVTSLGFDTLIQRQTFDAGRRELKVSLILRASSHMLAEVSVTG